MKSHIFCAIDTQNMDQALRMTRAVKNHIDGIKLGLEFFMCNGAEGVNKIRSIGGPEMRLFLDLKFHDIPNTVAGAVRSVIPLKPDFLTIHASGGADMMRATKDAAVERAKELGIMPPKILAVTALTHLSVDDMKDVGQDADIQEQVKRLAELSMENGLDGVVCSPLEIETLRKACGDDFILMVPGIRPENSDKGDQTRVMTPVQAIEKGADYLVIGRPITTASNPEDMVQKIVADLESSSKAA